MPDVQAPPTEVVDTADEELGDDLRALGEKLLGMAQELSSGRASVSTREGARRATSEYSDQLLAAIARAIYRARKRRAVYFEKELLGEPAWDILLELFVSGVQDVRISTTSLCLAAGVPTATASRTIQRMEREGLVRRYTVPNDKRVTAVEITATGYKLMRNYILDGVLRDEMPVPESS